MNLTNALEQTRRTRELIEDLISDPTLLGPDFQPIRDLADGSIVAHKATGRGQGGTDVADALQLLAGAQSLGLVERLDWAFRCHTLEVAMAHGLQGELHLTPEPETFLTPCPPRLVGSWSRGRSALRIGAELHDDAFADLPRLRRAVEEMHGWGWSVVVADVADLPAAVDALPWLRPSYVQVDVSRPGRAAGAARWVEAARESGAKVMALGVDGVQQRADAESIAADVARGQALGSPGPLGD